MKRKQARAARRAQGMSGWFPLGAYTAAEQFFDEGRTLRADYLRLAITAAQWDSEEGRIWVRWLAKNAARSFELTIALYRQGPTMAPALPPAHARETAAYRRVVQELSGELAARCEWLELADPLGPSAWPDTSSASGALLNDLRLPGRLRLCLGGLPLDPVWVNSARTNGLLRSAAALAFCQWSPDQDLSSMLTAVVEAACVDRVLPVWLTPERLPARAVEEGRLGACVGDCVELMESAAERFYFPLRPAPTPPCQLESGLAMGGEALAARLLRENGQGLRAMHERLEAGRHGVAAESDLVIGGAGFVGCNMAARLAAAGRNVLVLDNLSRAGTEHNLSWLSQRFPRQIRILIADIRDEEAVCYAVERARRVFHFAAQVAVTTSLTYPQHDHQVNATGTLNVLEALRRRREPPPLLFTSTNKVYGELSDIALELTPLGYQPVDPVIRAKGVDESRPLSLCSPYGCSKGAADQYVLDYARSYGLPVVVFRMSCIYGPRQFGNEDQGWVAHFVRQTLAGEGARIYGDGHQTRDVLFIDDLVEAALRALERLPATAGEVFNVGGGVGQAVSLNGLLQLLGRLHGTTPEIHIEDWRPSDQRYYVSDSGKLSRTTGWRPQLSVEQGVHRLYDWMRAQLRSARPAGPAQGRMAI